MTRPLLSSILLLGSAIRLTGAPPGGEAIYKEMCASCHGRQGEGVAGKADEPLYGERSLEALGNYIDRKMPEDEADKLNAEDAATVAAFIYDAFYSPTARARLNPAARAVSRLTNRQFQESVADLFGSLHEAIPSGQGTGVRGQYFQSDGMNKKAKKALEREDKALEFDFKEGSPAGGISADQFSIAWDGSLLPHETGWHDFRLRTPNGARLYLNSNLRRGDENHRDDSGARREPATIDAWVSSGSEVREATARAFLLGGRAYPFRLDYFKFKEKSGSVKLEWKSPTGAWEVLGAPNLSPAPATHVTVVTASFPADDGSAGYERGTSVSKDWHEATTKAALEAANELVARMDRLVPENDPDRVGKAKALAATLAERAFRRPLTDDLRQLYVERPFAATAVVELGLKRSLTAILKSPRFLYPDLGGGQVDQFTTASRLALTLWDSLPDASLAEAAKKGELASPDQVRSQAERMLGNPRTRSKVNEFFRRWLLLDDSSHLQKDTAAFPEFNASLVQDARRSLELFVDRVVWSESSDYRELLLADYLLLNSRLAKYYGAAPVEGGEFQLVKFDPAQRAGIFTHPFLLTSFAYFKSSSPIHRGVFLTRNVLGRFLKPPPMAIEFMDDRFDPSLTMREKVTELTNKAACMGCHSTINPLGFSLENFDATGRWRTTDNNKPVNPVSDYVTTDGETVQLKGARDLAEHAANSRQARRGFVRHLFHSLVKQPPAAYGAATLEKLEAVFTASNCNIKKLIVEIAVAAATASQAVQSPAPASKETSSTQ